MKKTKCETSLKKYPNNECSEEWEMLYSSSTGWCLSARLATNVLKTEY